MAPSTLRVVLMVGLIVLSGFGRASTPLDARLADMQISSKDGSSRALAALIQAMASRSRLEVSAGRRACRRVLPVLRAREERGGPAFRQMLFRAIAACAWIHGDTKGAQTALADLLTQCRGAACRSAATRVLALTQAWLWPQGLEFALVKARAVAVTLGEKAGEARAEVIHDLETGLRATRHVYQRVMRTFDSSKMSGGIVVFGTGSPGTCGLRVGDVIRSVNRHVLTDLASWDDVTASFIPSPSSLVPVFYLREGVGHETSLPGRLLKCDLVAWPSTRRK